MATAMENDESITPKDFNFTTLVDSDTILTFNHHICQLCNNFRRRFYCQECIQHGDFRHSTATSNLAESFADNQENLAELKRTNAVMQQKCLDILKQKSYHDHLVSETRQCKQRISHIQTLINDAQKRKTETNEQLNKIQKRNEELKNRLPRYSGKVAALQRCGGDYVNIIGDKQKEIDVALNELKSITRVHIEQLIKYIFPISKVLPTPANSLDSIGSRSSEDSMIACLSEAQRTVFVRDRWIQLSDHESTGGIRYSVVAPTLPGSGDYSAYHDWVATHSTDSNALTESGEGYTTRRDRNIAFTTTAALTYTAQLVNILAFYLDVNLPYKSPYKEFCKIKYLREGVFQRRVAKLNGNVLHLCFSQNVNPQILRPSSVLHNILCLLNIDVSDLGRRGPVEIDPKEAFQLEEQLAWGMDYYLKDKKKTDKESGSEDDIIPWEWEAVPHTEIPEADTVTMGSQSGSQSSNQSTTTSIASGLVTSAAAAVTTTFASLWKGLSLGK